MGAAASVKQIYKDAIAWFCQYFDDESFVSDFHSIDRDHDGAIRYQEFISWLQAKSNANQDVGAWRFFVSHPEIVAIAHLQASSEQPTGKINRNLKRNEKIVDITDFKSLLIQLFVVSIIWTHFKKADEWNSQSREEAHDGKLTENEFIMAVRSFTAAYTQEDLSEEKLRADFKALDLDGSGAISLLEICTLVSQFINPTFAEQLMKGQDNQSIYTEAGLNYLEHQTSMREVAERMTDEQGGLTTCPQEASTDIPVVDAETERARHQSTSEAMMMEITKNANIAEFMEMKMATEQALLDAGIGAIQLDS